MEKTRTIFIYLAVISVILGSIGVLILVKTPSGKVVIEQNIYSMSEIQKHNNAEDCWIYSGDKVYDITLFLQVYEDEILKQGCGGGVSLSIFDENVQKILQSYEIGNLK